MYSYLTRPYYFMVFNETKPTETTLVVLNLSQHEKKIIMVDKEIDMNFEDMQHFRHHGINFRCNRGLLIWF